jgi:hypothetical protein
MDQEHEYWVESESPGQRRSRLRQEMMREYRSQMAPWFALWIGLPCLLFYLIIQAISADPGSVWGKVQPWMAGSFLVVALICGAIVAWRMYLAYLEVRTKQGKLELLEENVSLKRQASRMIRDADRRGDNVKLSFGEDGAVRSAEIVRSALLLEQQRLQLAARAGQRQVSEVKEQKQLAEHGAQKQLAVSKQKGPALLREPRLVVPGAYDLLDVIDGVPDGQIFLGVDHRGRYLCCDVTDDLCHGALNAVTGRGKTILIRGLEAQLLALGAEVVHADIKFSLIDEKGNDYRPIAQALMNLGEINMGGLALPHLVVREDHICHLIQWLAGSELRRRLAMYAQGNHSYKPFYLVLEELVYLIGKYKDLGRLIGEILVVGRSLGIKVIAVGQNFQVQNLKINSGMRENFESAWYLGGDMKSGAALLDWLEADLQQLLIEHNIRLGSGVNLFRNNKVAPDAVLMRAGMASNGFVYHMLGEAEGFLLPDYLLPDDEEIETRPPQLRIVPGSRVVEAKNGPVGVSGSRVQNVPAMGENGPVVRPERGSEPVQNVEFVPLPTDKMLSEVQQQVLIAQYKAGQRDVKELLRAQGLGVGTYYHHACYVLDSLGLRQRRA